MIDVTLWAAFIAGIASFVSPCVLPLVPPYLSFLAGVTFDELAESGENHTRTRWRIFSTALAFVLGFSAVFVALGATASALGSALRQLNYFVVIFGQPVGLFSIVAGVIIIVMGLHFLGVFRIGLLDREARFQVQRRPTSLLGAALVGVAFGLGWTPCLGPVLGTLMAVAGSQETVGQGAFLLSFYSLGMGLPFLIAAAFAGAFLRFFARFRRHLGKVEKAMGGLLVVVGVLFIFGQMTAFSYWLLEFYDSMGWQVG